MCRIAFFHISSFSSKKIDTNLRSEHSLEVSHWEMVGINLGSECLCSCYASTEWGAFNYEGSDFLTQGQRVEETSRVTIMFCV